MTTTPLTKPIEQILDRVPDAKGPKGPDDYYTCRCPAHDDKNPSLSFKAIGDECSEDGEGVSFHCFAGCSREAILEALHLSEKDLHYHSGSATRSGSTTTKHIPTLTLFDLAVDKHIHPNELLTTYGVTDGKVMIKGNPRKGVVIPYFTEDGKQHSRIRLRIALEGERFRWSDGDAPLIPYGLNWLETARKSKMITIVEGESDCWTLWHYGLPALGIPGVELYSKMRLNYLQGIERVYIIQEPPSEKDKAEGHDPGRKFVDNLKKHLNTIGYRGKVYSIDLFSAFEVKDPNDLHKKDPKNFKSNFEKAISQAIPMFVPGQEPEKPEVFTLQDLMKKELKPPRWVIPDYLPEGLFLLTGKPKLGKSWLGFDLALGIAWGGVVMGKIRVEKGEVLYLALEDNERRIQKRMKKLLVDSQGRVPEGLHMSLTWPRIDKGGAEMLDEWVKEHPDTHLIIVDTWAKISPRLTSKQQSLYETQYDSLVPLKAISDKYGIAIMAVHHNRKMSADDVTDEISGSTGLTGSVDGFWIIKRERGQTDAVLHIIGRDIEEEQALAINFDPTIARWRIVGNAEDLAKTKERQAILDLLAQYPQGLKAKEISDKLQKKHNTVRNLLVSLREEKKVLLTKDTYTLYPSQRSQHSQYSDHSQRSQADNSTSQNGSEPDYDNAQPDYGPDYGEEDSAKYEDQPGERSNGTSHDKPDYADYADYDTAETAKQKTPLHTCECGLCGTTNWRINAQGKNECVTCFNKKQEQSKINPMPMRNCIKCGRRCWKELGTHWISGCDAL